MEKIRLGRTGLLVTKTAFGALPIQRISKADAVKLVRRACEAGINYFDTANMYTDSEEKLGEALHDVRQNVVISTKSGGGDKKTVQAHIEQSLRSLRTDYIDLFQFHNPAVLPDIHDPDGPFAAALEAKQKGYIRHIGITNHRLKVAHEAIESGNFETLQFPFCYLATEKDLELVELCREHDMGFIAMKGLSGGLLNNAEACYAFMQEHPDVVPIWGIQHEWELDQWLELTERNPRMTPELQAVIDHDRTELSGDFCRSCGYCLPCAAGIDIPPGGPDGPAAAAGTLQALSERRVAGEDAPDQKLHPLQRLQVPLSLWAGHPGPAAEAAGGLRRVLRRPSQRLKRRTPDALPQ